jgi:DNA-binding beta-propeller fold protein YncE
MNSSDLRKFLVLLMGIAVITGMVTGEARAEQGKSGYHVIKKTVLGGEGYWDYLTFDSETGRLYVSHATHVEVFDTALDKVVGDIPNTEGVHGIALVQELGRGFISNGASSTVTIFDLKTLKEIARVKSTGQNPDSILYDPVSRRVFAFNGRSGSATAIDPASGEVVGTVDLGGGKVEAAAADGKGRIFVNIEDKSTVVVVDSKRLEVESHWPLAPCEEPSGMAMDREHRRLFIACSNHMMAVLDADSGHVVATPPIGSDPDGAVFDTQTGLIFTSNREGTLTVVHEDSANKYRVVDNVKTQYYAKTLALDPKTHRIFLVTAEMGARPAPTPEQPRPRPAIVPGTFTVLVVGK